MPDLNEIHHAIDGRSRGEWVDRRIAKLAERQQGLVTRRQLQRMGLGRGAIEHRIRCGRVHLVYRGVYTVGHNLLSAEGRIMAAVLASGPGACASHRAGGILWGVWQSNRLEVTVAHSRAGRPGILLHYRRLPPDEVTTVRGIPVTTLPRTLFDLASVLSRSQFERALNEAEIQLPAEAGRLGQLAEHHRRCHGAPIVRAVLADRALGTALTRSELEAQFLRFLRKRRLPRPKTNIRFDVGGQRLECDCVWEAQRLVVELDGRAFHATAVAFERDRQRDRMLSAAGWRVVRITWRQLRDEPERVAGDLRKLLLR